MTLAYVTAVCILDTLGRVPEGTSLAERFHAVVRSAGDRALRARFWWNIAIGMRAAYANEDPWNGLQHSDAIQAIFDVTGGEQVFLNMQLFRGMNLWYLGAFAPAERTLVGI